MNRTDDTRRTNALRALPEALSYHRTSQGVCYSRFFRRQLTVNYVPGIRALTYSLSVLRYPTDTAHRAARQPGTLAQPVAPRGCLCPSIATAHRARRPAKLGKRASATPLTPSLATARSASAKRNARNAGALR